MTACATLTSAIRLITAKIFINAESHNLMIPSSSKVVWSSPFRRLVRIIEHDRLKAELQTICERPAYNLVARDGVRPRLCGR